MVPGSCAECAQHTEPEGESIDIIDLVNRYGSILQPIPLAGALMVNYEAAKLVAEIYDLDLPFFLEACESLKRGLNTEKKGK